MIRQSDSARGVRLPPEGSISHGVYGILRTKDAEPGVDSPGD